MEHAGKDGSIVLYAFYYDKKKDASRFEPDDASLHLWRTTVSPHEPQFTAAVEASMRRKRAKLYMLVFFVVSVILLVIVMFACGGVTMPQCVKDGKKKK